MSAPMDERRLAEILARVDAAAPGPWESDGAEIYGTLAGVLMIDLWVGETLDIDDLPQSEANARFAAAARTDVPELAAEVRRLRELWSSVTGIHERQRKEIAGRKAYGSRLKAENAALAAEVQRLLEERHTTNEILSDTVEQQKTGQTRIAELKDTHYPKRCGRESSTSRPCPDHPRPPAESKPYTTSASTSRDPVKITTKDGAVWVTTAVTRGGRHLYAPEGASFHPGLVMATVEELAEHGIRALSQPLAPSAEDVSPQVAKLRGIFTGLPHHDHAPRPSNSSKPIHDWFELTYSTYLVLHRSLLQSMPVEWQRRLVLCLDELRAAFAHVPQAESYQVHAGTTHLVSELDGPQLAQLGITEDWYRGEAPPEGLDGDALKAWEIEHEDPDGPVYRRDGQEVDRDERVVVPGAEPVPHYDRGCTYIEPRPASA